MKSFIGIVALIGLAVALPTREKRQAVGCVSAFQNVPNVCRNNPSTQVFFAHPTDPTKFLQCDVINRMYIIQCPQGEVFDMGSAGCQPQQQVTASPVTAAPFVPRITTPKPVVMTYPPVVTPNPPVMQGGNPCSAQMVARGQLYFAFPGDSTKFYECDLQGNPSTLTCPHLLVWDQTILSCVYPVDQGQAGGQGKPTPQIAAGGLNNPCTQEALTQGRLFFAHPDQTKYIQCDLWGDAFVNACPSKLIWNPYLETCYNRFAAAVGTVGK